ncbi:MAG: hypothetical protein LUE63_09845, partial [Lachnospiraceae bacterium]|nr:hypothetical protein [Lachnospiraceae bacterium]
NGVSKSRYSCGVEIPRVYGKMQGDFLHFSIDFAILINYNEFANCTRLQENLCSLRKRMILWKKT